MIGILFGGDSLERGVSINSARTLVDHLGQDYNLYLIYCDTKRQLYEISATQIYSNTTDDFEFKSAQMFKKISLASLHVDLIFSVIHGRYGEFGELQELFEANNIKYIGSNARTCKKAFQKNIAQEEISKFMTPMKQKVLNKGEKVYALEFGFPVIVKPARSGSSFFVNYANNIEEVNKLSQEIFNNIDEIAIIEPVMKGTEFSITVIQKDGEYIPLLPTEIIVDGILTYRKKYLPTNEVEYITPATFSEDVMFKIVVNSIKLCKYFEIRDFIRIDGWVCDDEIYFSDINVLCGLEQNSYVFMQAAEMGLNHKELLNIIIQNACRRYGISLDRKTHNTSLKQKKKVNIIAGGITSERQVSLMSGSNVYLKLQSSDNFDPSLFLLFMDAGMYKVAHIKDGSYLYHTTEEVVKKINNQRSYTKYVENYQTKFNRKHEKNIIYTLNDFLKMTKDGGAFLFIALHGGIGENGELQDLCNKLDIKYNGSNVSASKLCMNKYETEQRIIKFNQSNCVAQNSKIINNKDNIGIYHFPFVIKPINDGCSNGVELISNVHELQKYFQKHTYENGKFMTQKFIETDKFIISNGTIIRREVKSWIELTISIFYSIVENKYIAFIPSLTIAESSILSIEEKFQSGTGINITPPPKEFISDEQINIIKEKALYICNLLNVENYARLDVFFNTKDNTLLLIEINTLPALTPSTVLFQQACNYGITPLQFLESIIIAKSCETGNV